MSNSIAPGSSADVNVKVTALTTNQNVPVTYKTIILKKNLFNGVNTLTQEMMSATNTKYVIKYDYVLGDNITIPENCMLNFDGGSISASGNNDTIIGSNTSIEAELIKIFNTDVTFEGVWNIAESYPEWFGAKGDGINDDTNQTQKALNFAILIKGKLKFNNKKYCISSINISHPVNIEGTNNKSGYDIYSGNENFNTTIIPTSLSLPCFNLLFSQVTSGISIRNIKFEHNITELTVMPYVISDENSTSFASGIIIENLCIPKAYNGIKLYHCERFTIRDINADCANNFLSVNAIRDVSILENIHIWNFSKIESFDTFKIGTSSDYAIKMLSVDEVFTNKIFIYRRNKGIYLNTVWGNFNEITLDQVNKSFDITSIGLMGVNIENCHIISVQETASEEFNAVEIYSNSEGSEESCVRIKDFDYKVSKACPQKIFNINTKHKVIIDNAILGWFQVAGIYIESTPYCSLSNINFAYKAEIGGDSYNGYNIINNEPEGYVAIHNICSNTNGKLYDGYFDNVIFDYCESIKDMKPYQNGASNSSDGVVISANQNVIIDSFPYVGINNEDIRGIVGIVYKVTSDLNNNPIGLYASGTVGNRRIYINEKSTNDKRVAICRFVISGSPSNKNLSVPDFNAKKLFLLSAIGTYNSYRERGEICEYDNAIYIVKTSGIANISNLVKIADM